VRRYWTMEELFRLEELYPECRTDQVASEFGRGLCSVYNMAQILGLAKSQTFLDSEESGRLHKGQTRAEAVKTQFPKGHVPANKGLRRPGYAPGRMKETQFQKGQRTGIAARNWMPIGTIRSGCEGYLRIKVREAVHGTEYTGFGNTKVWPLYNRWLWEQQHGPIPPKHIVAFTDGDRSHCVIENLELRSKADNARRNGMWTNLPRELAEAIQLNGALKRKIRNLNGKK
jgi:hypothetical protein